MSDNYSIAGADSALMDSAPPGDLLHTEYDILAAVDLVAPISRLALVVERGPHHANLHMFARAPPVF